MLRRLFRSGIVLAVLLGVTSMVGIPSAFAYTPKGTYSQLTWTYVSSTHSCDESYNSITISSDSQFGNITFTSYSFAQGPNNCSNSYWQAPSGSLSEEQDIYAYNPQTGQNNLCNKGPRIANEWYPTHYIVTSWTTNVPGLQVPHDLSSACGSPGRYFMMTTSFILDPWTGRWQGGGYTSQSLDLR